MLLSFIFLFLFSGLSALRPCSRAWTVVIGEVAALALRQKHTCDRGAQGDTSSAMKGQVSALHRRFHVFLPIVAQIFHVCPPVCLGMVHVS